MEQTEERTVSRWGDAGRHAEAHADARGADVCEAARGADVRRADTREAARHADAHEAEAIAPKPLRVLAPRPGG